MIRPQHWILLPVSLPFIAFAACFNAFMRICVWVNEGIYLWVCAAGQADYVHPDDRR